MQHPDPLWNAVQRAAGTQPAAAPAPALFRVGFDPLTPEQREALRQAFMDTYGVRPARTPR